MKNERISLLRLLQQAEIREIEQVSPGGLINDVVNRLVPGDAIGFPGVAKRVRQQRDLTVVEPPPEPACSQ